MFNIKSQTIISACLFSASILSSQTVFSGIYTGYEADNENTQLLFVGGQTDDDIFLNFFAANLQYEFLDGNTNTEVDTNILNIGLGFKLGNNNNYSFIIGPTYNNKTEHTLISDKNTQSTGVFYQFGANATSTDNYYEFLSSYSTLDRFIWSRGRYKSRINSELSAGTEIFWMGNDDGDSWGGGLLFEYAGAYANAGLKAGYKRSTNEESGTYFGLEFYIPF